MIIKIIMKKVSIVASLIALATLSSCSVVGGIFKAGMVWGIILVVLVVAGIIALIARGGKK